MTGDKPRSKRHAPLVGDPRVGQPGYSQVSAQHKGTNLGPRSLSGSLAPVKLPGPKTDH